MILQTLAIVYLLEIQFLATIFTSKWIFYRIKYDILMISYAPEALLIPESHCVPAYAVTYHAAA